MGQALIVAVIPEELLSRDELGDVDPRDLDTWLAALHSDVDWRSPGQSEVVEHSPGAYLRVPLRYMKVWALPEEPWQVHGPDWHRDPQLRRAHHDAVRRGLQEFLNGQLAKLYHMVRTGWWVLGKARVKVTECRPVPEREMRARARAVTGGCRRTLKPLPER
jgi:hypothetical protein